MMTVLDCIAGEHNPWLVLLAALVCGAGAWATTRLFLRSVQTRGVQRIGWNFLTAMSAGVAIWCTHFIAMLGFDAGAPVGFDPGLTAVSLFIAVAGSAAGFMIAGAGPTRYAPLIGGAVVGLAIAAMHYVGMIAYRVQGVVSWDMAYLAASIVLSVVLSAAALHLGRTERPRAGDWMAGLFAAAIVALHFTGMAAFRVQPLSIEGAFTNPDALRTLAMAVAGMSFLIVGVGLVSYLIDDNSRAESVERLRVMALNDVLTGLPNRANFNQRIDLEIDLARDRKGKLALIGIDLNRFKEINDVRGHAAGDEVLRVLGRRIKALLREETGEFVARTGGDEFAATCRIEDKAGVSDFLERLEAALSKPIHLDGCDVLPGASFGVSVWPDDARDKEDLIGNADLAMYRAKADPIVNVCYYEPAMDEAVKARRGLAADLRRALDHDELSLHYQVQTLVTNGRIQGYEALLRWNHPRLGQIPPTEFIPIAEETGLILQIGQWVLKTACAEAAAWDPPYKVAVNLSAVQFVHADLPRFVMAALVESGLPPERLELELTESAIFADLQRALHMLRQIKALGVRIALDDFGTGYSSLDTLRSFPFDRIKIDRSFFTTSQASPQTTAVIRAVLGLGKSFGIPVLAEGVETYDQLSMLNAEGCDEAQGFLLGRPAPLEEIFRSGQLSQTERAPGARHDPDDRPASDEQAEVEDRPAKTA